jgi:hypothetical protein
VKDFNNCAVGWTTLAASLSSINICRFVVQLHKEVQPEIGYF